MTRLCSILNAIPTDRGRRYRSLNRGVYYFQSLTAAFQALPLPELPIAPLSASLVRLELLSCQASFLLKALVRMETLIKDDDFRLEA